MLVSVRFCQNVGCEPITPVRGNMVRAIKDRIARVQVRLVLRIHYCRLSVEIVVFYASVKEQSNISVEK
jgi:hypothetical protein